MVTKMILDNYKVFVFILVTNKFEYNLHSHIYVYLLMHATFVTLGHYCRFQCWANFVTFILAGYFLSFPNEIKLGKRSNDMPCAKYRPYIELSLVT